MTRGQRVGQIASAATNYNPNEESTVLDGDWLLIKPTDRDESVDNVGNDPVLLGQPIRGSEGLFHA